MTATLLDKVIAGAIEDTLSTGALLRHMLMLGSRLKSEELLRWSTDELNGYSQRDLDEFPSYRGPLRPAVVAQGVGESDYQLPRHKSWRVEGRDIPREHRGNMLSVYLHHPLAELEKMASRDEPIKIAWSNTQVSRYNRLRKQGEANGPDGYKAEIVLMNVPPSTVHGIVDTIRTRALMFALKLQTDYPDAGEINGPTTETQKVRETVTNNFHTTIYGGNNTVANGENITQNVQINQGDTTALLDFFKTQGLDEAGQTELSEALKADGDKPGSAVTRFLERLGSGAIKLGTAVASPVAFELGKAALSSYFGVPLA
jgi:hypothetical protein